MFRLCTIPGVVDAIWELAASCGRKARFRVRALARTEPLFQWAFEGCHLTRDIPALIEEGGFPVERMETGYVARFPKSGSYYFWGVVCMEPR